MSKRLIIVLALAFVVGIAFTAYAEVQNVKVSGDLLMRAISRANFSLLKAAPKYKVRGLTSTVRVRVDADLTDNVIATVRLLNERSWGTYSGPFVSEWADTINIDLAYVTLKEFLYSPLTLTVGRQELRFGNALVIGDVDSNLLAAEWQVPYDLSSRKAFDAIRANLNYDPLVVDLIYAKISGDTYPLWWSPIGVAERKDTDLYGMNAAYNLKDTGITGTAQLYLFSRANRSPVYTSTTKQDICNTIGMLVSGKVVDNLTGSLEYAYQFGNMADDTLGVNTTYNNLKRRAFALQGLLNYAFQTKYNPSLTMVYTYLSGDKTDDRKYKYWDPMYEDQIPNSIVNALFPQSNVQCINLMGSIKPMEDVTLSANYSNYRLAQKVSTLYGVYDYYTMTDKKDIGNALDLTATYDYTEDVQLGLTFGYFNPGSAFSKSAGFKENATQVIGSMKVTF